MDFAALIVLLAVLLVEEAEADEVVEVGTELGEELDGEELLLSVH